MEQAGTRILNMNECMNECRIWTVSLKLALVSHKDASPCGLSLWPRPCPPRMLLYPQPVFFPWSLNNSFFRYFIRVYCLCVFLRCRYIRGTLFFGDRRVNWASQNGIPGEFWNWSSDTYKRYPLPTKLHAAHCMSSALTTILICCIFVFFLDRYHFVGRFGWAETVFSLRILVAGDRCNITGEYFERVPTSE